MSLRDDSRWRFWKTVASHFKVVCGVLLCSSTIRTGAQKLLWASAGKRYLCKRKMPWQRCLAYTHQPFESNDLELWSTSFIESISFENITDEVEPSTSLRQYYPTRQIFLWYFEKKYLHYSHRSSQRNKFFLVLAIIHKAPYASHWVDHRLFVRGQGRATNGRSVAERVIIWTNW